MQIEDIAEVCHNVNRAYCQAIGDDSQPVWTDAPDWMRDGVIAGVYAHINNPDMTPEESHNNWMRHKAAEGWIYGVEKNPDTKEHPCMVHYDDLPAEKKVIDYLFKAVVDNLSKHFN